MGFLSSVKKAVSTVKNNALNAVKNTVSAVSTVAKSASKAVSNVQSFASNAVSNVQDFASVAGDKLQSAVNIAGVQLQTALPHLPNVVANVLTGNYTQAGAEVLQSVAEGMAKTDRSGTFNPAYAYKQAGFPNDFVYKIALELGIDTWGGWVAYCSGADLNPQNGSPLNSSVSVPSSVAVQNVGSVAEKSVVEDKKDNTAIIGGGLLVAKMLGVF